MFSPEGQAKRFFVDKIVAEPAVENSAFVGGAADAQLVRIRSRIQAGHVVTRPTRSKDLHQDYETKIAGPSAAYTNATSRQIPERRSSARSRTRY